MDKMNDFINGIGSMAELTYLYYSHLMKVCGDKELALMLTALFVRTLLESAKGGSENG